MRLKATLRDIQDDQVDGVAAARGEDVHGLVGSALSSASRTRERKAASGCEFESCGGAAIDSEVCASFTNASASLLAETTAPQ
jgi:hypothetical protein